MQSDLIRASYRAGAAECSLDEMRFAVYAMKNIVVIALALLAATVAQADERKFTAADVPHSVGMKQHGRVVISNDGDSITAFRFFGEIREALFSLRSLHLATHSFGSVVFDSSARLNSRMPTYLSSMITEAARMHGVDPRLVAAVAHRESAFNASAMSPVGARGIMQLMPTTARYLGVSDIDDTRQNVFAGARYLRKLLDSFNGDLDLTLAAYNAGPGAVRRYRGVPPFHETKAYVAAVRATYERSLRD
jgi:soluble lytic murein transglycosylase-like protein